MAAVLGGMLLGVAAGPAAAQAVPPEAEEGFFAELPLVVTASRLPQSRADAPVSVTVIDRELIEASGVTEVAELLRLVPGFIVGYDRAHAPVVAHLLANDAFSRRMQVMVDGRSVYVPTIGGPVWSALSLNIDDIERIEVVRGPNSATYGSNSFLGVINIITRPAALDAGLSTRVNAGERGLREVTVRSGGGSARMDYRLTAWYQEDSGFRNRFDGRRVGHAVGRIDYQASVRDRISVQVGFSQGDLDQDEPEDDAAAGGNTPPHGVTIRSNFQLVEWERMLDGEQQLRLRFYHNGYDNIEEFTLVNLSPPLPMDTLPYDQSRSGERYDLEVQHSLAPLGHLRLAWGASLRRDQVASPRFLGRFSPVEIDMSRLFGHGAWEIGDEWLLHAGLMIENNGITGTEPAGLLAANWRLRPGHTLRLSASTATRTPVAFEAYTDTGIDIPGVGRQQVFFRKTMPDAERITSYELAWVGTAAGNTLAWDVSVARHRLRDLVVLEGAEAGDIDPDNEGFFTNGGEADLSTFQAALDWRPRWGRIHATWAHTDIDARPTAKDDQALDQAGPEDMASLLVIRHLAPGWSASAGAYYLGRMKHISGSRIRPATRRYDLRLAYRWKGRDYRGELALTGQNLGPAYTELHPFSEGSHRLYASLKLEFR